MFAYQHSGVVPDILTLAKPLAGGLPMGAILLKEELTHFLKVGDHGSTFGGNAVCAAAALAVLDHLESPGFLEDVAAKGLVPEARAREARPQVQGPDRRDPRPRPDDRHRDEGPGGARDARASRRRASWPCKAGDRVVRLLPPLVVKRAEIRLLLQKLEEVLATGAGARRGHNGLAIRSFKESGRQ